MAEIFISYARSEEPRAVRVAEVLRSAGYRVWRDDELPAHRAYVEVIEELYAASQAGVEIDLIVRGICMLRPGVAGLSENIRVRSIVGRFLEHSRIFYFANGGKASGEEVYIGSADWMFRNLDRRVEVAVPIIDVELKKFLMDVVLSAYLRDTENTRVLLPTGAYKRIDAGKEAFDSQMYFVGMVITP